MNQRLKFKHIVLIVLVFALALTIFAACGDGRGSTFTPVEDPPLDNAAGTDNSNIVSTVTMSGENAMQMIYAAMDESIKQGKIGSRYMNFAFSTYFILEREEFAKYYYIDVKGALNTEDPTKSQFSLVLREVLSSGAERTLLGFYEIGETLYIDLRGVATSQGIHVLKTSALDLEWLAQSMQSIFRNLDLGEFLGEFQIADLLGDALGSFTSIIGGMLGSTIAQTVINISGTSTVTTYKDGTTKLSVPLTPITTYIPAILAVLPTLLSGSGVELNDIYEIVEMLFGWDLPSIISALGNKEIGFELYINASIVDGVFYGMDLQIDIDHANPLDIYLGMNSFALGSEPNFNMPDFTNVATEDYSLTTINADVELCINAKENTYYISGADPLLGELLSSLVGDLSSLAPLASMPINIGADTVFRLHLKIRAEIDLRDNNNTQGVVEIRGGANDTLRAALYYVGADEALYIDLSGMGGGRYKIDSYVKTKEVVSMVPDDNGAYINTGEGFYKLYTEDKEGMQRYKKVVETYTTTESINLNTIIKDALADLIKGIPSIAALITGYDEYVPASGEEELLTQIFAAFQSGEILIPHYGAGAQAGLASEVDIMSLIKQILSCASIDKGEGKFSFDSITIDLTEEVISTIFYLIKPGLSLPITELSIYIGSEDAFGIKSIVINAALGDKQTPDLISLSVPITIEWGRHLTDWSLPNFNDINKPFVPISLARDSQGNMEGISTISLSLDGYLRLQMAESLWDMSELQSLIYGILIKMNVTENIDAYLGFTLDVNLDIATISTDILGSLSMRLCLIPDPDANSIPWVTIYLNKGILYVDAVSIGIPLVKMDIGALINGTVDFGSLILSKDPYAVGGSALSTAETTLPNAGGSVSAEEGEADILGIIAALISGVNISSSAIEVALATNLLSAIINAIDPTLLNSYAPVTDQTPAQDVYYVEEPNTFEVYNPENEDHQNAVKYYIDLSNVGTYTRAPLSDAALAEGTATYAYVNGSFVAYNAASHAHLVQYYLDGATYKRVSQPSVPAGSKLYVNVSDAYVEYSASDNAHNNLVIYYVDTANVYSYTLKTTDIAEDDTTVYYVGVSGVKAEYDEDNQLHALLPRYYNTNQLRDFISGFVLDEKSGLAITFDGLNLSELYINANIAVQNQTDPDNNISLGFGLGHILVGLEAMDLMPVNAGDYADVLNDLQIYLAMELSISMEMLQNEIDINSMLGAVLGDLMLGLSVEEDINPGLTLSLQASLDLATIAEYNETQIKLEIKGLQSGVVFVGVYYEKGRLYVDVSKLGIEKFYLGLDIVELISGALAGTGTASGSSASAAALDLTGLAPIILLSRKDLQVQVTTGLTAFLLSVIADAVAGSDTHPAVIEMLKTQNGKIDNLNIPELGVEVALRWSDGQGTPLLNALQLGIDIYALNNKGQRTLAIGVQLGGIELGFKTRNLLKGINLAQFAYVPLITVGENGTDIEFNLDNVFAEITGYIYMGAFQANPEETYASLGDYLTQFFYEEDANGGYVIVKGKYVEYESNNSAHAGLTRYSVNYGENTSLMQMLSQIILRFQVLDDIEAYLGFRIAANLALAPLLSPEYKADDAGDMVYVGGEYVSYDESNPAHTGLQRYTATTLEVLLEQSELAVELYNGLYSPNNDPILSVYMQGGVLYIRLNGKMASNVRLKLDLMNLISGVSGAAMATADGDETFNGIIPENILGILNGALAGISINSQSLNINIGSNLLGAVLGLIPAVSDLLNGADPAMPQLNEENSKISIGRNSETGKFELALSIGIDPVAIGIALNGFRLGFGRGAAFPLSEENLFETEYKSLAQLTTLSLQASLGLDIALYESELAIGDVLSAFISGFTTSLGITFEDDLSVGIEITLAANLDITNPHATEISLEIHTTGDSPKRILGVYLEGDSIYANFEALNVAPFMVSELGLAEGILAGAFASISGLLGSLEANSLAAALATAEGEISQDVLDILFMFAENNLSINITTGIIVGLLSALLPDVFTGDFLAFFKDVLKPSVNLELDTSDITLGVGIDTPFLSLGIWVGKPVLGTEFIDGILAPVTSNRAMYTDFRDEDSVFIEIDLAVRYRMFKTTTDLDCLLEDLAAMDFGSTAITETYTVADLLRALLIRLAITDDAMGEIGIKLMATANVGYLIENIDGDLDILSMLEIGVEVTLGQKKVYIMLTEYDGAPYLFANLEQIGAPNFRLDLRSFNTLSAFSEESGALATADEEDSTMKIISSLLDGVYIGIGRRGLAVNLAFDMIGKLLTELLTDFELSSETLSKLNFVNEKIDDSAFMLTTVATDEDKMDNREYVKINGEYVLFDEGNVVHQAQANRYYKIRSTGITFKTHDPKNDGKPSVNVDLALGLGIDVGISIYGYRLAVSTDNLTLPLGDLSAYPNIVSILNDKIYVSLTLYFELGSQEDVTYGLNSILDVFLGDMEGLDGLSDMLLALALDTFKNRFEIRISAQLTIADFLGDELDLTSLEAAIELVKTHEDGTVEVFGGIYLIDNNAYLDLRRYNGAPIIMVKDFASSIVNLVGSLGAGEQSSEGGALSTANGYAKANGEVSDGKLHVADIVLGTAGLGLIGYTDLIPAILNIFGIALGLEDVFGEIGLSVMLNYKDAKYLSDISLDIDLDIGALNIGLGIGGLEVGINNEKQLVDESFILEATNITEVPFSIDATLSLRVAVNKGKVDIGALLSDYIPNLSLEVNVPDQDGAYMQIDIVIGAVVNLSNFNTLEIMAEVYFHGVTDRTMILGAYYTGGVFYIDATGMGIEKVKITGLDIGAMLEEMFGEALGHDLGEGEASAAALDNSDREIAAVLLLLDGKRIAVQLGAALIDWVLNLEAINIGQYIPAGLDVSAFLDINYINPETGKLDLSLSLGAEISQMAGIYISLYNINIGLTEKDYFEITDPYEYVEILRLNNPVLDEYGNKTYDPLTGALITETAVVLEHVALELNINLYSLMCGDENGVLDFSDLLRPLLSGLAADLVTQFQFPEGPMLNNFNLRILADVKLMELMDIINSGNIDIAAILNSIELLIEITDTDGGGSRLMLGVYLIDGAISLYLEGLGFPNITVSGDFLSSIINKLTAESAASALATADGDDDTLTVIAGIINSLIYGIEITGKTLIIVIENTYLTELFNLVFPDMAIQAPAFDIGRNAIALNFNRGYYVLTSNATELELFYSDGTEYVFTSDGYVVYDADVHNPADDRYYHVERNGLVEIDLSFYSSLLGVYLQPPAIMLSSANIELPDADWTAADEVRGVSIELRGRVGGSSGGITGVTLGSILNNIVGDLDTLLIFDNINLDINFSISVYLGFDYDIEAGTFNITELDLAIKLIRNSEGASVTQAAIYYSNTRGTVYVDLSYYGLPKLSINGIKLSELLGDLLGGTAESGSALATDTANASASTAVPGIFTSGATILALMQKDSLIIGISSKILNALITLIAGSDEIAGYLPNLGIELAVDLNPFILSVIIQLQDGEYNKVIDLFLEFYGFNHDEWAAIDPDNDHLRLPGSDLRFYKAGEYAGAYIDIDTSAFTNIMTLNLNADTELGEEVISMKVETLAISATLALELTAKNIRDWAEYFTSIFGLSEDEMNLWIAILNSMGEAGESTSIVTITIDGNLNLKGLMSSPMSLKGTEARITLSFMSSVFADAVSEGCIVITLIGENEYGMSEVYLDLSNYRNKGRHKIELDLAGMLSGVASSFAGALATDEGEKLNTGIIPEDIFKILNSILGKVEIANNKIIVGVKPTLISGLFDLLLADNPNFDEGMNMPLVDGELSITIGEWDISLRLAFDNGDMAIGLRISDLLLKTSPLEAVEGSRSLKPAEADQFTNLFKGQLLIELLGVIDFEASKTSIASPAIDLSSILKLITNDTGMSLVQNPLFQVRIANDIKREIIIDTQIFVDLNNFNNLKVAIAVFGSMDDRLNNNPLVGIYVDGHDAYLDLSFLGIPRMRIEGLNLGDIINGALESTGLFGAQATASYDDFVLSGNILPYAALVFMPEKFAIGLNAKLIDAIYKIVLRSRGNEVEEGISLIPDIGDIALILDSTTTYVPELDATPEQVEQAAGKRYVYDTLLTKYVRVTSANEDQYNGYARYIATGGKPLPELAIKMGESLYFSLRLRDINLDGSSYKDGVTFGSFGGFSHLTAAEKSQKTVYNGFMDYVYERQSEYQTIIKFENGLQALLNGDTFDMSSFMIEKIAIGFDINFTLSTKDVDVVGQNDHPGSIQNYLSHMLASLLGGDPSSFGITTAANTTMSYTLSVKIVADLSKLITASGFNIGGLLDSEMAIEIKMGAPYNKLILGLYKKAGDDAIYANLANLGLPKVKLFGLGTLLKGMAGGSAAANTDLAALTTAQGETANAAASGDEYEQAFAEIVLDDGSISINIEPEFIYQIIRYAGLEIVNYSYGGVDLYKGIEFVEADGSVVIVPLPDAQSVSITIEIPDKLSAINIDILADKVGTKMSLSIRNFNITFDTDNFITEAELPSDDEDYGALFLAGGTGFSLRNMMASLLDGINLNLNIALNKRTSVGDGATWMDIGIVTTTPTSKSTNGYLVGANKIMARIDTNKEVNVSAFVFNNKISADLSGILDNENALRFLVEWVISLIGDGGIIELADLNILELIGGMASSVSGTADTGGASQAAAASSTDTAQAAADLLGDMSIKDLIKGIKVDWWNGNLHSNLTRNSRYTSIRVDLNYQFVNKLMMMLNFLLGGLFAGISESDTEIFNALSYEDQYAVFMGSATPASRGLSSAFPTNMYNNLPGIFVQFVKDMLSDLVGSSAIGDLLGLVNSTLFHVAYCILPFPFLTADDPCYIDITLDKGLTGTSGMSLISEIGIYLGENKGESHVYGSGSDVAIDNNSLSIIINNAGINVKSAKSWDWYNTAEATQANVMFSSNYTINDAFDAWEISDGSLSDPTRLPQRAHVEFTDGTNSKTAVINGSGDKASTTTLPGTHIIWDTSAVDLTPGATSVLRGYALNQLVKELTVTVGNTTGYRSIYGYLDKNGTFIRSSKLIIDPLGTVANSVAYLPDTIVIVLNNGNFQVLNTNYSGAGAANYKKDSEGEYVYIGGAYVNYDADNEEHAEATRYTTGVSIFGITDKSKTKYGQLKWINSTADYLNSATGDVNISFWYQVNNSSRITIETTAGYTNRKVASIILPNEEKYNILAGGTTLDVLNLTADTYDIAGNLAALTKVDVMFTDGTIGQISVEWDLEQLNNRYDKNQPYKGVEAVVTATLGKSEGIEQVINLNVDIDPKILLNITKVNMATPSFTYNPYDDYDGGSIELTDGNKLNVDMNINGTVQTVLTPVTLILPDRDTVNLSYLDGAAFVATVQVGGIDIGGTIVGAQTAKVRVYVEKMIAKTANIRVTDTWETASASNGVGETVISSMIGQKVQVVFTDNSTNMLTVKDLSILAGQTVTNKGGAFTARAVVGNVGESVNDQTLNITVIVPRRTVVSATANINRNNPYGGSTASVTYTNGQTVQTVDYAVEWPANLAELIEGQDSAEIPVTIGSQQITLNATVYNGPLDSKGYSVAFAAAAEDGEFAEASADAFTVEYIVNPAYRSITVDPMTMSSVDQNYPSKILVKIAGQSEPVLMDSVFFALDPDNEAAALEYYTFDGADVNRQYVGGDYPNAIVRLTYNGDSVYFNVPVKVLNREIESEEIKPSYTFVNPFAYNADPSSLSFSYDKKALVTYASGDAVTYPITWSNIDVSYTVEKGLIFTAVAEIGSGLAKYKKDVAVTIRPYIITADKLFSAGSTSVSLQAELDTKDFHAYSTANANNPMRVENYPSACSVIINNKQVKLEVYWDVDNLSYNYNGGNDLALNCSVGTAKNGYQTVKMYIDISGYVVSGVAFGSDANFTVINDNGVYKCNNIDPLDVGKAAPSIATVNVTYTNGVTVNGEKVVWDMSAVTNGNTGLKINGGTFTVYAIIRGNELAGAQKIPVQFSYIDRSLAVATREDGSAVFTSTVIDPYNAGAVLTPETLRVTFADSRAINFSTRNTTYRLVWNKANYNTAYNSSSCYITANLYANGLLITKVYEFSVTNLYVSGISFDGQNGTYRPVTDSLTSYTIVIDPLAPNQYTISSNVWVTFNRYTYGTALIDTYIGTNGELTVSAGNAYSFKDKTGTVHTGTLAVNGNTYSFTVGEKTYSFTFAAGDRALAVAGLGVFNRVSVNSGAYNGGQKYAFEAIITYSGGYKITSDGGNYSAAFKIGNNETVTVPITVLNRNLYATSATAGQPALDSEEAKAEVVAAIKTALGFTPQANYSLSGTGISLPTTANLYYGGSNTVSTVNIYWKIVKTYNKRETLSANARVYTGYDFTGNITAATRTVTYYTDAITSLTVRTSPASASYTLDLSAPCKYDLVAYVGRVYEGNTLKLQEQYEIVYSSITVGGFSSTPKSSAFFGAWRSSDLNYNYFVIDNTNVGSMRMNINGTVTEGTVVSINGDTMVCNAGGTVYTFKLTAQGITVTYAGGVIYCVSYDFKSGTA